MDVEKALEVLKYFAADNILDSTLLHFLKFLFAMILCALLSYILSKVYVKYGNSLSNRKVFAKNFVILATTTMFIIMVVKSSLALSLGLVGALSIVRFRAAIKEPEELAYLFLNIAIGLGCGASQIVITLLAFVCIVTFIVLLHTIKDKKTSMSLYMLVVCNINKLSLSKIVEILSSNSITVKLKRTDETDGQLEASLYLDLDDIKNFESIREQLLQKDEKASITFMDTSKDY